MEQVLQYSPIIIVLMMFLIQHRIFVTPEQLEKKHREIIESVEEHFVSLHSYNELKEGVAEMKDKIDKIYDVVVDSIQEGVAVCRSQYQCPDVDNVILRRDMATPSPSDNIFSALKVFSLLCSGSPIPITTILDRYLTSSVGVGHSL